MAFSFASSRPPPSPPCPPIAVLASARQPQLLLRPTSRHRDIDASSRPSLLTVCLQRDGGGRWKVIVRTRAVVRRHCGPLPRATARSIPCVSIESGPAVNPTYTYPAAHGSTSCIGTLRLHRPTADLTATIWQYYVAVPCCPQLCMSQQCLRNTMTPGSTREYKHG